MIRKLADLVAVVVVSLLAAAIAYTGWPAGPVRAAFGVAAVLFAPGYALVALALPSLKISPWERLLLSLGVSFAVAALGGLLLQFVGISLRPASWILMLVVVTTGSAALAAWRRQLASGSEPAPDLRALMLPSLGGLLMLAGLVPFALEARQSAADQPRPGFTQLWLVPPQSGAGKPTLIGVSNREGRAMSYLVEVQASALTSVALPIRLDPNASWETTVGANSAKPGLSLEVRLYRTDDTRKVYRRVTLPAATAVVPR